MQADIPALAPIRRVAIIGAGAGGPVSGAALASLCVRAGLETVLEDILPGNLRRAAAVIPPGEEPRYATSIEDAVRDADLVIDTVPDELESKLEILSLLDRMAPPAAVFLTPTEVLSIADLASCTYRPGQCFAFRVVSAQPLGFEVTYSPACLGLTLLRIEAFCSEIDVLAVLHEDLRALP